MRIGLQLPKLREARVKDMITGDQRMENKFRGLRSDRAPLGFAFRFGP